MPSGIYPRKSLEDRFWEKVRKTGPIPKDRLDLGPCWTWTGCKDKHGYGNFSVNNSGRRVHRIAYELVRGKIPAGLTLDHLCRNRACPNPFHCEAVTLEENKRRGFSPCAIHARKTHCKRGHVFDATNTILEEHGRRCRKCTLANQRKRYRVRKGINGRYSQRLG